MSDCHDLSCPNHALAFPWLFSRTTLHGLEDAYDEFVTTVPTSHDRATEAKEDAILKEQRTMEQQVRDRLELQTLFVREVEESREGDEGDKGFKGVEIDTALASDPVSDRCGLRETLERGLHGLTVSRRVIAWADEVVHWSRGLHPATWDSEANLFRATVHAPLVATYALAMEDEPDREDAAALTLLFLQVTCMALERLAPVATRAHRLAGEGRLLEPLFIRMYEHAHRRNHPGL